MSIDKYFGGVVLLWTMNETKSGARMKIDEYGM